MDKKFRTCRDFEDHEIAIVKPHMMIIKLGQIRARLESTGIDYPKNNDLCNKVSFGPVKIGNR